LSYTTETLVKNYLDTPAPVEKKIYDQTLLIEDNEYAVFYNGAVLKESVTVKAIQNQQPERISLILNEQATTITGAPLMRNAITVASDSSLGLVYRENIDYAIDYEKGMLIIKEGGWLSTGMKVTVWYLVYRRYLLDVDYSLDAGAGKIKRAVSGGIIIGETVYIDYAPVYASYSEALVHNAVTEANRLVEKSIDPAKEFGADAILQSAATNIALEIICRVSAIRELSRSNGNEKSAETWLKLAEYYQQRSERMLDLFRPPLKSRAIPTHS